MQKIFVLLFTICSYGATAQPLAYTVANTHSHNDYEQHIPFWMAYNASFGSIEADIFLRAGKLLIGHDTFEIKSGRTLEEYYIRPLDSCVRKNNGYPFADTTRQLQILIDVKTDSTATLDKLVEILKKYPSLISSPSLKWVISGNRPDPSRFASYPSFIWFDGVLHRDYSGEALGKIALMSDDLKHYSKWNGRSSIPEADWKRLQEVVGRSHRLHKPVRFWDAPDFSDAWSQLVRLQVDYINTDHIRELADFLNSLPAASL